MTFYSNDIYIRILFSLIPSVFSFYFFYVKKNIKVSLGLLILSGFLLRLMIIGADPYLFDWDERFHALVAKHMMDFPFKPMLRLDPISPYQLDSWCCNHIWVHKQPLFLWQMAISMKIFGKNIIAMRLPSAIMGAISIYFIYEIALFWTKNNKIAFLSSLLFCFSYYQLELTSGRFPLDLNDVAFSFYVTASIWAFVRYLQNRSIKWAVFIGFFVGGAILNKWLTGLLIFGGWGLYIILDKNTRFSISQYFHLFISVLFSFLVFLPWQIFIKHQYPLETAYSYAHNMLHITSDLGHSGSFWYHFNFLRISYGFYLLPFIPLGILTILYDKIIDHKLTVAFLSMIAVIYGFFSFIVKTKMEALPYPVNSLLWILIAFGLFTVFNHVFNLSRIQLNANIKMFVSILLVSILSICNLKPWEIMDYRSKNNTTRNNKISNTLVYKNLDLTAIKGRVVLNCNNYEDNELMFFQDINAYHWYPEKKVLDSLINKGHKFAAFESHREYQLPSYITDNKDILIIHQPLK